MAKWVIKEEVQDGRPYFVLFRDRQWMMSSHEQKRCELMATNNMLDGDTLESQEPDGYRTRLKGRRRGWRR